MKPPVAFLFALTPFFLGGCAAPILGPLTLSHLSTIASATTMTIQGKGAAEVALDLATGKDCRMMEGIMRNDRAICEENGSVATDEDFKGVIAFLADRPPASKSRPGAPDADRPEDQNVMLAEADAPPRHAVRSLRRVPRVSEPGLAVTRMERGADAMLAVSLSDSSPLHNEITNGRPDHGFIQVSAANAAQAPDR